jgi:hypothetical protein
MVLLHRLGCFLGAVAVAAVSGSVVQTQFNLLALRALDVELPALAWVATTAGDIVGFGPTYALVVAVAFLLALPAAAWLARRWPGLRQGLYTLAGAAAILAALLAMNSLLSISVIAATRSLVGLAAMVATGALGGLVYAWLSSSGRSGRR